MIVPNKLEPSNEERAKWTEAYLEQLIVQASSQLQIGTNRYYFQSYESTFTGASFTSWLVNNNYAADRAQAVRLAQFMVDVGMLNHILREGTFTATNELFRFTRHEKRGVAEPKGSWAELGNGYLTEKDMKERLLGKSDLVVKNT